MKIFKILLVIIVIVVVAVALGVYLFLKNFDLNQYKDQISDKIGKTLQTQVTIGGMDLRFAFKTGLMLDMSEVSLADQGLLSGLAVDVREIQFSLDVMKFLETKELVVIEALVREPVLHVDLEKRHRKDSEKKNNFAKKAPSQQGGPGASSPMSSLVVQGVRIVDGKVILASDGKMMKKDVEISAMNLEVNDIFFRQSAEAKQGKYIQEPFSFQFSCAAFGAKEAVALKGKGRLGLAGNQVRFDDIQISSRLKDFFIPMLVETFPQLADLGLKGMQGNVEILISQLIVGGGNVPVLVSRGTLSNVKLSLARLPAEIRDGNISFEYSDQNLDILDSHLKFGEGIVGFQGRIEDVAKTQIYHFDVNVQRLRLQEILPKLHPEITFSGEMNGKFNVQGGGFKFSDLVQNAKAETKLSIENGRIENFNLLNFIFQKISIIPNLAQRFEQALPEDYRRKMEVNETVFEDIGLDASLDSGVVSYATQCIADIAELDAKGTLDWKMNFVFGGDVSLPSDLSNYLVQDVGEFAALVNKNTQKVVIPLKEYTGSVLSFRPFPDMEYLAKTLVVSKAKEEIKSFLGEALGIERKDSDNSSDGQEGGQSDEGQRPGAAEDLIDNIFDSIFQ